MNKKAFIHHPITWVFVAFILGMVVMYLIAINVIPFPMKVC